MSSLELTKYQEMVNNTKLTLASLLLLKHLWETLAQRNLVENSKHSYNLISFIGFLLICPALY